ncbi:ankyrin repeat protein [Teladorsagia circumcincta]|uniref:Ankyrin repeat protein n=1 Tax=Teladorsagia circumcincta TaxID=45464 RepID=A0A2G9UF17_TELCI|nr:ankyrin repeat protein [Teladorsagia circumcincta]
MKQNNRGVLTAIDHNGFTCAHIAAMKGSLAVVKELMMIDKAMVIQAKTKTLEHGMTALHLGAKNGFVSILEAFDKTLWRRCSKKTGLNAMHIAAYYGNSDFVNEMLKSVPASIRSEPPIYNHHVVKEFATEYGFTPLHLAAQSGHDSLVRMLLNQGVQVDATSTTMVLILVLSAAAIAVHVLAFLLPAVVMTHLDNDEKLHFARTMLYLKNQLFAFALLFAFVEYLDFLTVHHLFGPWAIIISRSTHLDCPKLISLQPAYQPLDEDSAELMRLASPEQTLEMLFFSLFGLVEPDSMPPLHLVPDFAKIILKLLFGIYMMVTLIEWKFGRAILIRQMNKRSATPSPINMLTKLFVVLKVAFRNRLRVCTQKAQQDLRFEENIDAFSMGGGHQGRTSPTMREDGTDMRAGAELGASSDWSIETVIDWKRIVSMYYQMNGKANETEELEEQLH